MRHIVRTLAAAAFAAILASAAGAAPSTGYFEELRAYMQTRYDGILPNSSTDDIERRTSLAKGLAALKAKSTNLDGDVRMFGRIAAAIDRPLLRPEVGELLQDAIVKLQTDARPRRDALAARIDRILAPKLAASATNRLADIDASLNSAVATGSPYTMAAQDLLFALRTISATNAQINRATAPRGSAARPGVGFFECLADGARYAPQFGSGRVKMDNNFVSEVTLTGYFASEAKGGIEIQWSTGSFTSLGTYHLDGSSGAFIVLNRNGEVFWSDDTGGEVTVTYFDPVTKRIAGTFNATLVSSDGDTLTIEKGSFDVRKYAVSGK
jgi:hypothetical protein